MEDKLIYWLVPKHDFAAERRVFYKDEEYPVYQREDIFIVVAENGEFNFTHIGFQKLMKEWKDDAYFKEVTEDEDK